MMSGRTFGAAVFFPVMIFGYMETLRRATFHAFGWIDYSQLFAVISVLVIGHVVLRSCRPSSGNWHLITGLLIIIYPGVVWGFFGLVPFVGTGLYGLALFLVTNFMFEQKSSFEMLLAGLFLMAVNVLVTGQEIIEYVFLNLFFAGGLKSQAFFLDLEADPRARTASGFGKGNFWAGAGLLVILVTAYTAINVLPEKPGRNLSTLALKFKNPIINEISPSGDKSYAYDLFWKKFEDFQFRGEVPFDNRPVMYVKSPFPAYWRGEAADFYTGRGWTSTLRSLNKVDARALEPSLPEGGGQQAVQEFRMAPGMRSEVIFYAGIPLEVEIIGGIIQTDEGDNLFVEDPDLGDMYKVFSFFPELARKQALGLPEGIPGKYRKLYLQLPETLPERVWTLAAELTAASETPLAKAEAIEDYLTENFPYKLFVNPLPEGRDVTDFFLFEQKEGYCTYHSTAMVVMLRSIGIPARWIKGFTSGTLNRGTGEYEVLMNDAHAWVEAYIPGSGWVSFDPTPPLMSAQEAAAAAVQNEELYENQKTEDIPVGNGFKLTGLFGGMAAAAGAAIIYYIRAKRRQMIKVSNHEVDIIYQRFLQLMAKVGYSKRPSDTPREFAELLVNRFPEVKEDILLLTSAYLKYKYAAKELNDDEMKEVRDVWRKIKLTSS